MMSAPVALTISGSIALTVAAVPTGMKAGVRMSPRGVVISPCRALPSCAFRVKPNSCVMTAAGHEQASVAIGIEAVAARNRMGIGALHHVEPGEGRHQHEQRGARQMEIGHEPIDRTEAIARRNEETGLA